MAIAYSADYAPKDAGGRGTNRVAKTPGDAVDRLVAEVYPGAARERAFSRVADLRLLPLITGEEHSIARYEVPSGLGRQAAVLTVAEQDGQYYVNEVAVCEHLAKRWSR